MHFDYDDDLKALTLWAREFAEQEIAPIAASLDLHPRFPWESLKKMAELGLLGVMTPESYGGAGLGLLEFSILLEEISAADASHGTIMSVTCGLPQKLILNYGHQAQKDIYLPELASGRKIAAFCLTEAHSGSDAAAMQTRAEKTSEGYVLNGSKAWITSAGEAQIYLVLAKTNLERETRGISCFILDKETPGLHFGKAERKLGQHASITASMYFDDCLVPHEALLGNEGEGFVMALQSLDEGRIGIAAQALGIARAAFEAATVYANERTAFGQRLRDFQGISFKLADMTTRLEASTLLTHKAAWLRDQGKRITKEAAMAKLYASETAHFVTHQALQIFGANGYSKDFPLERYYRDARVTEIYEGTSEIQRLVIARQLYR